MKVFENGKILAHKHILSSSVDGLYNEICEKRYKNIWLHKVYNGTYIYYAWMTVGFL
jgi:hypothetical protein